MSIATLAKKAYGELIKDEISTSRVIRGLKELKALGLVDLTPQFERLSNGDILNMPSVKAVTSRFWEVVRLWDKLVKIRGAKAAERSVQRLQSILAAVARREGRKRAERSQMHQTRGAVNGTPASRAAAAEYRARAERLGLKGAALDKSVKAYMSRWRG